MEHKCSGCILRYRWMRIQIPGSGKPDFPYPVVARDIRPLCKFHTGTAYPSHTLSAQFS